MSLLCEEIIQDPLGRNYASMPDQDVADDLNGNGPDGDYRVRQIQSMSGRTMFANVLMSEFFSVDISDAQRQMILTMRTAEDLDPWGNDAEVVKSIFGPGSTTIAQLADARTENISRSEELGLGLVKAGHVGACRQ